MNLLGSAKEALNELYTTTQLKQITDPAIVQRLQKCLALTAMLSKKHLQHLDKQRIFSISDTLSELLDYVPLNARGYRKQIKSVQCNFQQLIQQDLAALTFRKQNTNKATGFYDDLLQQHEEIQDLSKSVTQMSKLLKQQRQEIALQQLNHRQEIKNIGNILQKESFQQRKQSIKLREKDELLQKSQVENDEMRDQVQRMRQLNEENELASQIQLKELARRQQALLNDYSTHDDDELRYESTFNVPVVKSSVRDSYAAKYGEITRQAEASSGNPPAVKYSRTEDLSYYAQQLTTLFENTQISQLDTKRMKQLKITSLKQEIQCLLEGLEGQFIAPLESENRRMRQQLLEQQRLRQQEASAYDASTQQLQAQTIELQKLRYENQKLREEFKKMGRELEMTKIQSKYGDLTGLE